MCTFAARLAKLGSITVTFFVAASLYERVKAEVGRDFGERGQHDHCLSNIR